MCVSFLWIFNLRRQFVQIQDERRRTHCPTLWMSWRCIQRHKDRQFNGVLPRSVNVRPCVQWDPLLFFSFFFFFSSIVLRKPRRTRFPHGRSRGKQWVSSLSLSSSTVFRLTVARTPSVERLDGERGRQRVHPGCLTCLTLLCKQNENSNGEHRLMSDGT